MAAVEFSPARFRERRPQFDEERFPDAALERAFEEACLLLDNGPASPVPYDPERGVLDRERLLELLVCHLATLGARPLEQGGPVTSVTEGSVSVSYRVPGDGEGAFFRQTSYGETYWRAARGYALGGRYAGMVSYHPWG